MTEKEAAFQTEEGRNTQAPKLRLGAGVAYARAPEQGGCGKFP